MAFPAFAEGFPVNNGYSEQYSQDGDLVSQTDAGYQITRRKYSRRPRIFTVPYAGLNNVDRELMEDFIAEQGLVGNFDWINPVTDATHNVRMSGELPKLIPNSSGAYWRFVVTLTEV